MSKHNTNTSRLCSSNFVFVVYFVLYLYLYLVQYFHVLQDSKRYMTHPTVLVQSDSQITDTPLMASYTSKDTPRI